MTHFSLTFLLPTLKLLAGLAAEEMLTDLFLASLAPRLKGLSLFQDNKSSLDQDLR